ncbi:MAG: F0F1 ATP synthase subunit A [Lachnospiraceae bacterium]|nr:F0F1 ATP synthase subunit A [Lachnospiraceae bacterium]MDD3615084.1 F0F1 ATP synthase subunit A [Lachnospiraceae bacterium]
MGNIAEELTESLGSKEVFTIGSISINEAVVVTWIIMAVILILCIVLTKNLKIKDVGKRQAFLEFGYQWALDFFDGLVGKNGRPFIPYLITVLIYLGFANIIGLFGFAPPTKDLNVTAGLAIASIIVVEYAGIKHRGFKGWMKSFTEPVAIITPLNILEIFIRPLSLCMRLFGNMLGGYIILKLVEAVAPVIIPLPLNFYFDIFDGLLQAYVFAFLTSLYISEAVE